MVLAGPFHIQRLKAKESRKCMALTATDASPWSKLETIGRILEYGIYWSR